MPARPFEERSALDERAQLSAPIGRSLSSERCCLSVLDQSPISEGTTGSEALQNTIDLAQLTDRLGYHRYWVAEHHGGPMLAGPSPEALIGPIAAATERIRVGSGGVMLPHYSRSRSPRPSACSPACTRAGSTSGSAAPPGPTR